MRKTKVYWGYHAEEPDNYTPLMGIPPERLINNLKTLPTWRDTMHGEILKCPAAIDHIKNTYVIKSPCDETFTREGDYIIHGNKRYATDTYLQFHNSVCYYFFSESPVTMAVTPPYYHKGVLPGASASLDISKWFRPVSASILMEDYKNIPIKKGQPIMYVSFDKAVDLKQFYCTPELLHIGTMTVNLKTVMASSTLTELYNMFTRNKMNKRVMQDIKRNLL